MSRVRSLWHVGLGATAIGAFAIRLAYVLAMKNPVKLQGDGWYYHNAANLLADGHGFIQPALFLLYFGQVVPAADHPPGYIVTLAATSAVGLRSPLAHQIWSCLLGCATVVAVGLVAREVAGRRVGLIAAVLAAVYPNFWINDGLVMSETLTMLTAAVAVLLTYTLWRRPTMPRAAALGLAAAVFALTRSEALLLLPFFAVVVPLLVRHEGVRQRVRFAAVSSVVAVLTLTPWAAYNQTRFQHPVLITTSLGWTIASANCDETYRGDLLGYSTYHCGLGTGGPKTRTTGHEDLSGQDLTLRRLAFHYVSGHLDQLPSVVLARLGRTFGVYKPRLQLELDQLESGRPTSVARVGLGMFYVLALFAVLGAMILRRRGVRILPLVALGAMVAIAAAVTSGQTRYRAPAEIAIVVLAAVAIDTAFVKLRSRRAVASANTIESAEPESAAWQ